jgi:hypothetical protein
MSEPSRQLESPAAIEEDPERLTEAQRKRLTEAATSAARSSAWAGKGRSRRPREIYKRSSAEFAQLERDLYALKADQPSDDLKWLYENTRLVQTDLQGLKEAMSLVSKLPSVRTATEERIPRAIILARAFLAANDYHLTEPALSFFIDAVQGTEPLRLAELWGVLTATKLVLLELLAERGRKAYNAFLTEGVNAPSFDIGALVRSLRLMGEVDWREPVEKLSVIHRVLKLDPAGIYARMDFDSRESYRKRVAGIAAHSDIGEREIAQLAVQLATDARIDRNAPDALRERLRHVGYYLMDETGSTDLLYRAGYHTPISAWIVRLFHRYPDEVYILGIELITLLTIVAIIMSVVRIHGGWPLIAGAFLLLIPATQAAVELMNYLVTTVLTPHRLPKLDFSKGVDIECATMVAIPTLLINDKQIEQLVEDVEIRYLVNRDRNIFYALLTDLPDTAEPAAEQDRRVDFAMRLIEDLNRKYNGEPYGGFYLFHRHRVYNPREGAWMGWERKRGKLLDLNQYLRGIYDPFPVKAGPVAKLPRIRYVLTLDSDTALPRGSAQRMIGAMAHPLNRPLVDPDLNIVTEGYGILQPRVGVSVHSATRSRLASVYSGQTGFDIYSRAVSDIYQDLYGEGIFTGKGIYDVDALRKVLEGRFPRNALLSHDLIEGAYARAGLLSDVEVIDDYPSHYSAYNRRKHRWLRGDWQIVRWIFRRVPNEDRQLVPNPISVVSRWKILDNLRRSLVEPATFALLVAGWYWLPGGPKFWTIVTLALLFLPIYFRLIFASVRAALRQRWGDLRVSSVDFLTSHVSILLNIAFLAHQALVAIDAIVRTIVRSTITHTRLLEWETATEAELGLRKRTPVDIYLDWVPLIAILVGLGLLLDPNAAPWVSPFVIAWCCSKLLSNWLNRSPHENEEISGQDRLFLRNVALRTWRYFADFSTAANHWLIPDNVQQDPDRVAERVSPTNLGLLLNSRQAAVEFGYLTVWEFVELSERTLQSMNKLPRYLGHFANWYDTLTMSALQPLFISSVDSGNLVASLWALEQGCLELLEKPLLALRALEGIEDHLRLAGKPYRGASRDPNVWIPELLSRDWESTGTEREPWAALTRERIEAVRVEALRFWPWCLPEFESLRLSKDQKPPDVNALSLKNADRYYDQLEQQLHVPAASGLPPETAGLKNDLRERIAECRASARDLARRLRDIAADCGELADSMSFAKLVEPNRQLLSIGFDAGTNTLHKACYDLLASESRVASFIAVARGELDQESWFRLGRQHTTCEQQTVLISWTGTMFEYLMPALWMQSLPDTLLDRSLRAATKAQRLYGARERVPWGISEAAYSKRDPEGNYQYAAFGVPGLALSVAREGSLVISPYSSCLALLTAPREAVANLRRMVRHGWLSDHGFFESADYTGSGRRILRSRKPVLVRCWMAHHQGMSLAAICNLLHESPFQRWFHSERLVQASELILQERPLRTRATIDTRPRRVLPWGRRTPARRAVA